MSDAKKVVARMTVVRQDNTRSIVEVEEMATFHSFYRFYTQNGLKRSTKKSVRTGNRNEGLPAMNAHLHQPGLDALEQRFHLWQNKSNPVVSTKIRIIRKRLYRRLLAADPSELGLAQDNSAAVLEAMRERRSAIPVGPMTFHLVEKVNRAKLHHGFVR